MLFLVKFLRICGGTNFQRYMTSRPVLRDLKFFYLQSTTSSTSKFLSRLIDYEKTIFMQIWWLWKVFFSKIDGKSLKTPLLLLLNENEWHKLISLEEIRYSALFKLVSTTDTAEMLSKSVLMPLENLWKSLYKSTFLD